MDIPATLDTAKFRQLVLQGIGSLSGGGGGGTTSTNSAVGPDGVTRVPLQVNADGELKVNVEASIDADLTLIENKLDTIIGIETPQAADVAAINTSLNNGISVNKDTTGSGSVTTSVPFVVTTTNFGTLAFQSNTAATGTITIEASVDGTNYTATTYVALTTGNTSTSFNAAIATIGQIDTSGFKNIRFRSNTIVGTVGITYNLSKNVSNVMLDNPLPAGSNVIGQVTANAGTNLNTSALALESGGNLATVATKMSDGTQTTKIVNGANTLAVDSAGAITANNAVSQVYNYTATGVVALNTVLIGPIDCSQFRELSMQITALGTGSQVKAQISNDGTTWVDCAYITVLGTITTGGQGSTGLFNYSLLNAKNCRIIQAAAQTALTTTLVAYASQQATPKLYQSVSVTGQPSVTALLTQTGGVGSPSKFTMVSAATTNATLVKSGSANVAWMQISNTSVTWRYVKMFNSNTAPTVGTSTPVFNLAIAPNSTIDHANAFLGITYGSGVALAITAGSAALDATAVGAGDVIVNISYL